MEIEAKYTVPSAALYEQMRSLTLMGEYELRPAPSQSMTDHYLDTADWALLRGGYACRWRSEGGRWQATVKGLGGAEGALHQREEFTVEIVSGAPPSQWPESLARATVLGLCGSAALKEIFRFRQTRQPWAVYHNQRLIGEASLDEVEAEVGQRSALGYELEIELSATGTLDDLRALEEPLLALGLQPQPRSKFERALAWLGLEPPAGPKKLKLLGLRAAEPMAEAVRKILTFHFERMRVHEPGTRAGRDDEALHDMRVAVRRQRSALRAWAPHFRRKTVRPFQRALRSLARLLGAVRDWDVLLQDAQGYASAAGAVAFQAVLDDWAAQRETEHAALLAHLDSEAYQDFVRAYEEFLMTDGAGVKAPLADPPQPYTVAQALPVTVWERYAVVRAYEAILPLADEPLLHQLRIEAKRLRYTLEFFREVLAPAAETAIPLVIALQDQLGQLHDADVAAARVRAFLVQGAQASASPAVLKAAGGYLRHLTARAQTLRRGVNPLWRKVAGHRFRQWLNRALAKL